MERNILYPKTRTAGILNIIWSVLCTAYAASLAAYTFSGAIIPPADDAGQGIGNAFRAIIGIPCLLAFFAICLLAVTACIISGVKLLKASTSGNITAKIYRLPIIFKFIFIPFYFLIVVVLFLFFDDVIFSLLSLIVAIFLIATLIYERKAKNEFHI